MRKNDHKCLRENPESVDSAAVKRLRGIRQGMIQRCENKKRKAYAVYGGKGIKVCSEWRNDFWSFYNWAINNFRGSVGSYKKCRVYGISASEATDWANKWPACGLKDKEYTGSSTVMEILKRASKDKRPELQCEGQMEMEW